jgi:hypothetical protein
MLKLLLLYCTFLIGIVFLLLPMGNTPVDWFLFSDMELTAHTHVYFIGERVTLIILAYIIAAESVKYRQATWVFFWLMVGDLVDYCLSYNAVWFYCGSIPVSMNVVKGLVFGLVIINEWRKDF